MHHAVLQKYLRASALHDTACDQCDDSLVCNMYRTEAPCALNLRLHAAHQFVEIQGPRTVFVKLGE